MRDLAERWYESGLAWGVIGLAATLIAGLVGVWAAFRAARPRREILLQILADFPLIPNSNAREAVKISVDDEILSDARIVELAVDAG